MKAKKMFDKLGFKKESDNECIIKYIRHWKYGIKKYETIITFHIEDAKYIDLYKVDENYNIRADIFNIKRYLLKALSKQAKELGW